MRRRATALVIGAALLIVGAGAGASVGARVERGGTLRLVVPAFEFSNLASPSGPRDAALDPQREGWVDSLELFRCCLLRTLVAFEGRPTEEGGAELYPDLAERLPDISADGRTWTFRLRRGLRYAPPLEDVEITAGDVIRALERTARLSGRDVRELYAPIQGFQAFARGRAANVSGLEAPEAHTLVVHLTRPQASLGDRFALPNTAPIPPRPPDGTARFGTAAGHDRWYGRFLVASGPYMIEGAERLDPSLPPRAQRPAAGFAPGRSLTLVRNPSWDPRTDRLRPAYVDRIEARLGGTDADASRAVDAGRADLGFSPAPETPRSRLGRYARNPRLGRIEVRPANGLRAVQMNLAVPPFDDVHVRRAFNWVVDKRAVARRLGGPLLFAPYGHLASDVLERGLLLGYDPYRSRRRSEALRRARAEMRRSRYDRDRDGRCDALQCRGIPALAPAGRPSAGSIARDAARIGLALKVERRPFFAMVDRLQNPANRVPVALDVGFVSAPGGPVGWFEEPFLGASIGTTNNWSLVGAAPSQLRRWGYRVRRVPSVDGRIDRCRRTVGGAAAACLARLDQFLMERVVPWVPLVQLLTVQVIPRRVVAYSYDVSNAMPALDRVAVRPNGTGGRGRGAGGASAAA
jgi:peptide/nickel transport system substrate-binding protein